MSEAAADSLTLRGRRALVTGGGVRLGRALALALADAGSDVAVHYGHSAREAEGVAQEARSAGVRATALAADLGEAAGLERLIARAGEALGGLDILINNAALFLSGEPEETTLDTWERQFAVNLRAPFFLSQAFARRLPAGVRGSIVNVGDARVLRPGVDHAAYRLTKIGLLTMTEMLALALAPHITVNAVALGFMLPVAGSETDVAAYAAEHVPLRRVGSPEIVAANVLHLLRQPFITGAIVRLDGGEFL